MLQQSLTYSIELLFIGSVLYIGGAFFNGLLLRHRHTHKAAQCEYQTLPIAVHHSPEPEAIAQSPDSLIASLPPVVPPPTTAIVLQNHFQSLQLAFVAAATKTPDLNDLNDRDLIKLAKDHHFQPAKKWSRTRKLRSGEKQRAIDFLSNR